MQASLRTELPALCVCAIRETSAKIEANESVTKPYILAIPPIFLPNSALEAFENQIVMRHMTHIKPIWATQFECLL